MTRIVKASLGIAALALAALGARAATVEPAMKTIPPPAVETLRRALREAAGLVPAPEPPYVARDEETKSAVDPKAPWDSRGKLWVRPAHASAEYYYDVPDEATGVTAELRDFLGPIEVTVELNGDPRFADLASEGGAPTILPLKDATAVEVSAIVPGAVQGRVAPMTPRQAEHRLTALTIFVGDPNTEANIRSAVKNRTEPRIATGTTGDPSELHLIAVRIHGPRSPVEALARRIPGASLRRLLHR